MSSWRHRERRAGGDAELLDHDVDAGDRLRHRMLDLQPRVHLDEVELAVLVEELDRAGAGIAEIGDRVGDGLADPLALRVVQRRRRRLLPDLLVAPLQRAVALAEMDRACPSRRRAPGSRCGADGRDTFRCRRRRRRRPCAPRLRAVESARGRSAARLGDLHAAPAAAGRRLDEHRIADLGGDPRRLAHRRGPRRASPARPGCRAAPPSPSPGSCRP